MLHTSMRFFLAMIEWCVLVTYLVQFAALSDDFAGILSCAGIAMILALLAIVFISLAAARSTKWVWSVGGGIALISTVVSAIVFQNNPFLLLGIPIFSFLYLQRLLLFKVRYEFEVSDEKHAYQEAGLSKFIVSLFRLESMILPVFIIFSLVVFPHSYLPHASMMVAAAAYLGLRLISLLTVQRLVMKRDHYRPNWFSLTFLSIIALSLLAIEFILPYLALFGGAVGYVIGFLIPAHAVTPKQAGTKPVASNTSTRDNTVHLLQSKSQHATMTFPFWLWLLILLGIIAILWFVYRIEHHDSKETEGMKVTTIRQRLQTSTTLQFAETQSFVRAKYQGLLRLMTVEGMPPRPSETAAEYARRLQQDNAKPRTKIFSMAVDTLTKVYMAVRYTGLSESDEQRRQAEQGLKILEGEIKKQAEKADH